MSRAACGPGWRAGAGTGLAIFFSALPAPGGQQACEPGHAAQGPRQQSPVSEPPSLCRLGGLGWRTQALSGWFWECLGPGLT